LDISLRQWDYRVNSEKFYEWLRNLIDWAGPWKVLFASDYPLPSFWVPQHEWVNAIKKPDTRIPFTPEELEIIMGKAAQTVFSTAMHDLSTDG